MWKLSLKVGSRFNKNFEKGNGYERNGNLSSVESVEILDYELAVTWWPKEIEVHIVPEVRSRWSGICPVPILTRQTADPDS